MKIFSSAFGKSVFALLAVFVMLLVSCKRFGSGSNPGSGIAIDEKRAAKQIIPIDSINSYITSFSKEKKNLLVQANNNRNIDSIFSIAESFDRNTIIALLNAPGAENIRIYYGYKPGKNQVVFCLLPTDSNGNDIKVPLANRGNGTALLIPGISSANAQTTGAQGVENGQKCPTVCSTR